MGLSQHGGGFDVFCGMLFYVELQARAFNFNPADLSFSNIIDCAWGKAPQQIVVH